MKSSPSSENMLESGLGDMRQAVFSGPPFSYRFGNSTLHVQTKFVSAVALIGLMCLIILFMALPSYHISGSNLTSNLWNHGEEHGHGHSHRKSWFTSYNSTYPLTPPIYSARGYIKFRIAIISDLDTNSKHPTSGHTWLSYLRKGYLTINVDSLEVTKIEWDKDPITLNSKLAYDGRGMELSELITFNGRIYSLDDRTGVIYEIDMNNSVAIPWVILTDGNGRQTKGYLIHESCSWSEVLQRWVFLPRRASMEKYTEKEDEHKGTNLMIQATEGFENIQISRVGNLIDTHGFSSFKFVPGTKDRLIIALKSEEVDGKASTYILAFNINGDVVFPETKIADFKFEGIEFI